MRNKEQPKLSPVGLKIGDKYKHPFGEFKILDKRGEYGNREWYIKDTETNEELWVNFEFLSEIMKANIF